MSSGKEIIVMPSILSARMGFLAADCRRAMAAGAAGLHVDIMDGRFVPNLTMGPDILRAIREDLPEADLHVHLMVMRPDLYAPRFMEAGADTVLIHVEAEGDLRGTLEGIRAAGRRAGLTLCPETPVSALDGYEDVLDEVLVMTVHPGFGGQAFMESGLAKIEAIARRLPTVDIAVDGGITTETGARCAAAGANVLLAGSFLFKAADMRDTLADMRWKAQAAWKGNGMEGK
ncbi:MAG: ribulose-phosphate 3-epimerase [Verrucomicrobiota bacterium]|jgi:ribulose-phosphate 3-epimerase|nr:ribulose-phosphate 3-epimerase [Verrucomicrobiota bacterium]